MEMAVVWRRCLRRFLGGDSAYASCLTAPSDGPTIIEFHGERPSQKRIEDLGDERIER